MQFRTFITAAAAVGALALFAAPAQARTSVYVQIGTPAYVYSQPQYVYTQPSYVYTQPSYVYTQPSYVYTQPGHVYHAPRHHHRRHWQRDSDRDGVPNRFDRRPHNPYRY
jgi:hypothetical protein